MTKIIYQVDAFAKAPFKGNPAGVCIVQNAADEKWMQSVASEMNLSETAFAYPENGDYNLRWFTPRTEVNLCGHATLATAHVLWEAGIMDRREQARFHTRSGLLTAQWADDWIQLDFPSEPPGAVEPPPELLEALGASATYTGRNDSRYIVELESAAALRSLSPDFARLLKGGFGRVIVTSRSDIEGYDFVSRFFAPGVGINEDPVTGSAHCCLGPHWMNRLGKSEFMAFQVSERGGELKVQVVADRVYLSGQAVTVFEARLKGQSAVGSRS
jgi:predicted PhzF superfamily epimerase YddE/YHI9